MSRSRTARRTFPTYCTVCISSPYSATHTVDTYVHMGSVVREKAETFGKFRLRPSAPKAGKPKAELRPAGLECNHIEMHVRMKSIRPGTCLYFIVRECNHIEMHVRMKSIRPGTCLQTFTFRLTISISPIFLYPVLHGKVHSKRKLI